MRCLKTTGASTRNERALHHSNPEDLPAWWKAANIDAVTVAHRLWQHTRLDGAPIQQHIDPLLDPSAVPMADDGARTNQSAGSTDR
jgi:hypothetical protein